jgi:PAS domain S-box-containing protein
MYPAQSIHASESLLKSPEKKLKGELQLILNAIVEGLGGLDAEGNVTFCNDALLKMTGHRAEEMIGGNFLELLHHSRPDGTKYPAAECAFQQAIRAHEAIHGMGEFHWRKDGSCFPAECWLHPHSRMLQLPFATRKSPANLAQRMRPSHLAKQHAHELAPTGETPRVPFGLVLLDRLLEPPRAKTTSTLARKCCILSLGRVSSG